MVSDVVQGQVADIQGQDFKRLRELSILILSLAAAFFIGYFGYVLTSAPIRWDSYFLNYIKYRGVQNTTFATAKEYGIVSPHTLDRLQNMALQHTTHAGLQNTTLISIVRNDLPNARWIYLRYDIFVTVVAFVFLLIIAWYFWELRKKRQLHVVFIERKQDREQNNDKRFFTLVLMVLVGIITGLSAFYSILISAKYFGFFTYLSVLEPFDPDTYLLHFSIYSLLAAAAYVSMLLYFVHRSKPDRVQRSLYWLLVIPMFFSVFLIAEQLWANANDRILHNVLTGAGPAFGTFGSITYIHNIFFFSEKTLFLASFIILFYLLYHISVEHRKWCTFTKGENLQGMIDEGTGILPKKVYISDSYSVPLDLTLSECFTSGYYHDAAGCRYKRLSSDYLEAELQAVGLDVDGEKRVQIYEPPQMPVIAQMPVATWNCCFAEHGTHTINLMIHLVKPSNNSRHLIFFSCTPTMSMLVVS